jgi:hypothetical protein
MYATNVILTLTHPFWELSPNQLRILSNCIPVREVMLLSIDERHLLCTGDSLVSQFVVDLGGNGSVALPTNLQASRKRGCIFQRLRCAVA